MVGIGVQAVRNIILQIISTFAQIVGKELNGHTMLVKLLRKCDIIKEIIKGGINMLDVEKEIFEEDGCIGLIIYAMMFSDKDTREKQLKLLLDNPEALKMLCVKQSKDAV